MAFTSLTQLARQTFAPLPLCVSLLFCFCVTNSIHADDRPNIVFMMSNDQAWTGLSVPMHPELEWSKSSILYPYINGGFYGEVVERDGQVDPQPRARGVRPSLTGLRGAKITGFENPEPNSFKVE